MLELINDVLDLSKIEADRLTIQQNRFYLRDFLESIEETYSEQIRHKGLVFSLGLHEELPEDILSDQIRLRQVLVNLIGNAIKYTDSGSITVEVKPLSMGLRFKIKDTGVGIREEGRGFHLSTVCAGGEFGQHQTRDGPRLVHHASTPRDDGQSVECGKRTGKRVDLLVRSAATRGQTSENGGFALQGLRIHRRTKADFSFGTDPRRGQLPDSPAATGRIPRARLFLGGGAFRGHGGHGAGRGFSRPVFAERGGRGGCDAEYFRGLTTAPGIPRPRWCCFPIIDTPPTGSGR